MAPFSGEFEDVGKSIREGATLAFEEAKARGQEPPMLRSLDDQGNMLLGLNAFRRALREERIDAVIGPAMSDVATAVAIELSARRLPVPMLTPTATTHGIAALGDGVFQLNVTTHALGQRIAEYAVDCLGLKDFAIVAPQTEYGYQQADAFAKTIERKGGLMAAIRYVDPRAADYSEQFQAVREEALRLYFEKRKLEGLPDLKPKDKVKIESDSAIPLGGIFLPAQSAAKGIEAE
jgi:ABC-type branched-subunit amino acid transport system substrate-binding protein